MAMFLIITGPPASGKSTLAAQLQRELRWPLLAKDAIKESLFDALGWSDRAWSKRMSLASYRLMFATAREILASGSNCILEGNFRWAENRESFESLLQAMPSRCVQIVCTAPDEVLIARIRARIAADVRHPGHVDRQTEAEIAAELRERPYGALPLPGTPLQFACEELDAGVASGRLDAFVAQVVATLRR